MSIKDLIVDKEGKLSHTKIWSNIAYACATFKFATIPEPNSDIWLAYLGIVGGAAIASKLIQMKYGNGDSK